MKFNIDDNKNFWDEYAIKAKDNPFGAHSDYDIVELENDFIISELKNRKTRTLLDIGCGNGQRTLLFSKYVEGKVEGRDYSQEMINHANQLLEVNPELKDKIKFKTEDVNNLDTATYDVITSCRCFVNQPSKEKQVELFQKLYSKLNPGGSLIIAELSFEGISRLNEIRKEFNLEGISIRWFNLPIEEKYVFPEAKKLFSIKNIKRLGTFYYISRVINPALSFPEDPQPNSKVNKIGFKTELLFDKFFNKKDPLDKFGIQLLVHFSK